MAVVVSEMMRLTKKKGGGGFNRGEDSLDLDPTPFFLVLGFSSLSVNGLLHSSYFNEEVRGGARSEAVLFYFLTSYFSISRFVWFCVFYFFFFVHACLTFS